MHGQYYANCACIPGERSTDVGEQNSFCYHISVILSVAEQVVKGDCVYAVAVASNTSSNESKTVIQIPVSVHCSEDVQQPYATVSQLVEEQLTLPGQHYTQVRYILFHMIKFLI
jgi:hypothetical protein